MKTIACFIAVLFLVSCTKDRLRLDTRLTVTCKGCAVEYSNNGEIHRDTVIGQFEFGALDRIPSTNTWNLVREPGEAVYFRACRIPTDGTSWPITMKIHGDIEPLYAQADTTTTCAEINEVVRR